jgi:hypothetical protein
MEEAMLGQARYSRTIMPDVAEIERRLRALEQRVERAGGRASASASQAADRVADVMAAALSEVADHFRGRASVVGEEATKFGSEAARLGNDALRRLADEAKHRPLVILLVAAGIGVLLGLSARRR